ncbi:PREDICTED: probable BOI-related E3 ubiquitin-protein ligase 3 isoform X2 [Ipomoea nil]|uniref:probable BOI-related E3 ubiquitin-protein ligase 3 isoform X2 n=1 Tax=Ipomoea nil TaxID=35883 RepID=UPI000900F26B|nr:PREDICTED: probable BOI-related E3 ubiquitin-protein ligase 3 isoform X2 [Ipomoea nil]
MAVEARRLNILPAQLLTRETMNDIQGNGNLYAASAVGYGTAPLSGNPIAEPLFPMYCSLAIDSFPAKNAMKSDSGLTYGLPPSRKRSREEANPLISYPAFQNTSNRCGSFSFLGEDISLQIQQQQLEVDRFIVQHMEKVRMEIEERRKRYARSIVAVVEEGIRKRLRAKDEEIENIGKLNWALEERVKSLCIENQIWRDLAQTNEATANALRSNLEQVLAHVQDVEQRNGGVRVGQAGAELMDDAQSCCSSNHAGGCGVEAETEGCSLAETGAEVGMDRGNLQDDGDVCGRKSQSCENNGSGSGSSSRLCRNCGKAESCVLLLPCRHLCLCTACGSSLLTCPICKSTKNASLRVNFSS